ncbi:hypothetical protein [Lutibacter sp.]|uniref:hypothetical protein n=1 Tax=Lutibacter sp. TaxID=1925666 RepID=UPI0025BEEEF3|nr:hypothetical protein [Lutibacter sp.]MCF6181331.1 hypothetical protein [Lutibacter sp.]
MKSKLFLIVAFLITSFSIKATTNGAEYRYYNENGDKFTFVERGITFAVFQNGEFDFYLNQQNSGIDIGYRSRNVNISFNSGYNYDAYVQYDDYGAVIQVEDVPIYYDYYGRVTEIGNVNIRYNGGRLVRLGGLRVFYNNYGYYSYYSGYVNRYNRHYAYHPYHNYFVRPIFDFRIVSYKPYRHYYRPTRYAYHKNEYNNNHSYYNRSNRSNRYKRNTYTTRKRFQTNRIPKRKNERIATRNKRDYNEYNRKNIRSNSSNSIRRNTAVKRTNHGNVTRRTITNTHKAPVRKYKNTVIKKRTAYKKPNAVINKKRTNLKRNNVKFRERKGISRTIIKKPLKRNHSKTVNTRKRRG